MKVLMKVVVMVETTVLMSAVRSDSSAQKWVALMAALRAGVWAAR